ncbi:MAG: TIR domain-containing protein [Xanthobacteraceae bacterium]
MARIFISHASRDREAAEQIAQWLRSQGFEELFLDIDKDAGIQPGAEWERTLYREIARAQAVILIVTSNWHASRWCWSEFTQARALGKAIFPIIETPTGETLVAPDIQHLDLTRGREAGLAQLARAIDTIAREQHDFPWDPSRPPYPGLLAFHEEDAAIYFGRDDDIRRLIERLNARRVQGGARLIALLGASGSGKSSLLRAGAIPRLRRDKRNWIVLPPMRPRARPIDELASALAIALGGTPDWRAVRDQLTAEAREAGLAELARDLRAKAGALDAQILIPIDQFEELFSVTAPDEADRFLRLLSAVLNDDLPFLAVAAMRSDFLDLLQRADALTAPFEEFSLKPMPLARIAEIVQGPARIAGLSVEDALVARIAQDAATEDALPLLAFALRELYERFARKNKALTFDDYQHLGDAALDLSPLENAVRQAADDVLRQSEPSDEELKALRAAFVPAMVRVNEKGEYVRRPALWHDLPARAHRLLERLVQARLLVVRQEGDERTIEVAHEALLRKWPKLRAWLDEEREFLIGKTQLERALEDWQRADAGTRDQALLQGLALSRARQWLVNHAVSLSAAERGYIEASIAWASRNERKAFRQRAALLASVFGILLILMAGGPWAYGVIAERQLIDREAARTDISGQIVSYATTVEGGTALDQAPGANTSPYTTPLVQRLRQRNKSLLVSLEDVHQDVIRATGDVQRPFLSTSMNGEIYLWQQPESRTKRAVVVAADDVGWRRAPVLHAPQHDAAAVAAVLREAGFKDHEIVVLNNAGRPRIAQALRDAVASFQVKKTSGGWPGRSPAIPTAVTVPEAPDVPVAPANSLLFFFFSGHGFTVDKQTYVLPHVQGSPMDSLADVDAAAIRVQDLTDYASRHAAASVVILDTHFPIYRPSASR